MARYDWPRPPRSRDDPEHRALHLARFRPAADPDAVPPPAPRARRGGALRNAPAGNQNLWIPIGPSVMTNGQAGGNPNVAGRIRDLRVEPTAGRRLYAASAGGGVWFSADRGDSWRPLDDFQISDRSDIASVADALASGAVHVIWGNAADGSKDVVWVGTGEQSITREGLLAVTAGGLPGGKLRGIGLLMRDPNVAGGAWTVVKGGTASAEPDTLRGAAFYRIVDDPQNVEQLFAATTKGLFVRPAGAGTTWTPVTGWVAGVTTQPLDVLCTRATANVLRIWVATASALHVAEFAGTPATPVTPATLTFTAVPLPNVARAASGPGGTRLQLATDGSRLYVLGRSVIPPGSSRTTPPAALWSADAAAPLAVLNATVKLLTGMPPDLFMSANDQSAYDMCVAAHPSVAGRVYVGGAAFGTSSGWNGAVYRGETTATAVTPTFVGEGIHSDVHVLRMGPVSPSDATKRTVWVGCDGGLFRSDADGDPDTFVPRNDGLAVLQPGYVACHPTNPGIVVAGFQDNGTAARTGDSVWTQTFAGDGGGVVYDPSSPNRYLRQYTQATWHSSDGGAIAPIERRGARKRGTLKTSETIEAEACTFYSGTDALVHGGLTHLALGSNRVWYSADWGRSWVTLPTNSDPRDPDRPDLRQDVLDPRNTTAFSDTVGSVDCCSSTYTGPGVTGSSIFTVKLSAAPDDSNGKKVLRAIALHAQGVVWITGTQTTANGPFTWNPTMARQAIRNPLAAEQTAFHDGAPLRFLPATGSASDLAVHDATRGPLGSCYVATTGASTSADPLETLWFFDGTDTWLPTGLHHDAPVPANRLGTWAVPTDRVTAPALAVLVDPGDRRVVYVGTSVGVVRGVLTIGGTPSAPTYAWAWEQLMNGLPEAAVQDLSIFDGSGVKLLRSATQSRGVWELDLANVSTNRLTYLRLYATDTRRILPTPTGGDALHGNPTNPVHFDESPDVVIDTTGTVWTSPPTEAQLAGLRAAGPATDRARTSTGDRHPKVHVLVHHRGSSPLPSSQLKVALVRHDLPVNGVVPLGGLWPALKGVAATNAQPANLPDGWRAAAATLWQRPTDDVDVRVPRAITFDLDLSAEATGSVILLLAVVMSDTDQIADTDLSLGGAVTADTADQLVVASPHVAARSLQIS